MKQLLVLLAAIFALSFCAFGQAAGKVEQLTAKGNTGGETRIPAGSKVYVNPMDGFETYITAALQKKDIPLIIVANREQADFEIKGNVDKQKAGWAKTIFISPNPEIDATMQVINIKTGVVAFSNSSTKRAAARGRKGSAEHLAKNLAAKMQEDGEMKK